MKKIERKDYSDIGIIIALLFIITGLVRYSDLYYKIALTVLFITLIIPIVFRPLAIGWFTLAHGLSKVSSWIILTLIYIVVLLPVAMLMRISGRDVLKLRVFKKGSCECSVFNHRGYGYKVEDIQNPY